MIAANGAMNLSFHSLFLAFTTCDILYPCVHGSLSVLLHKVGNVSVWVLILILLPNPHFPPTLFQTLYVKKKKEFMLYITRASSFLLDAQYSLKIVSSIIRSKNRPPRNSYQSIPLLFVNHNCIITYIAL